MPEKQHAFAALLELQQAQKIKKTACWNSSKPKKSKNGPAGTPASAKNQKDRLLEIQQAQKNKKRPCWNSSKPEKSKRCPAGTPASAKNQKDGLLELQQAFAHRKRCSTLNTIIKKRTNLKARAFFYDSHAVKPILQPR
ncbi:hypothetical protein [Segatella oulorum]|uniref:hypothetical protein n=1 Tax=Segatella oulorum TaxID=28136 RepID=UPI0012DC5B98|nr:hypothetical protein [Segatella oulorum]